jgi:hypothetical protein
MFRKGSDVRADGVATLTRFLVKGHAMEAERFASRSGGKEKGDDGSDPETVKKEVLAKHQPVSPYRAGKGADQSREGLEEEINALPEESFRTSQGWPPLVL